MICAVLGTHHILIKGFMEKWAIYISLRKWHLLLYMYIFDLSLVLTCQTLHLTVHLSILYYLINLDVLPYDQFLSFTYKYNAVTISHISLYMLLKPSISSYIAVVVPLFAYKSNINSQCSNLFHFFTITVSEVIAYNHWLQIVAGGDAH